MSEKLLPCPFCASKGQAPILWHLTGDKYHVACGTCLFSTLEGTKFEVIERWNRRSPPDRYRIRASIGDHHAEVEITDYELIRVKTPDVFVATRLGMIVEEAFRRAMLHHSIDEREKALTEAAAELAAAAVFVSDYKLALARRLHAAREKLLAAFPTVKP